MRFFVSQDQIVGDTIVLSPDDAYHIAKVLRLKPGDEADVCAPDGMLYHCRMETVSPSQAQARVLSSRPAGGEPTAKVTVYAGLSKGERFDYLIQKCTEAGVSRIVPFLSSRCVARPSPGDYEKKRQRFARIALESSKQALRANPVEVGPIIGLDQALEDAARAQHAFFFYEDERQISLRAALCWAGKGDSFSVITGPEGGFSGEEALRAAELGIRTVSLGPRIFRCETAPLAALCAIMYHTGNFDIGE